MPVLRLQADEIASSRELEGVSIAACLHITKETAALALALRDAGVRVSLCASNPLSTQDDVAAFLAKSGIHVYGFKGMNTREFYEAIAYALALKPDFTMDDGGDLVSTIHKIRHGRMDEAASIVRGMLGEQRASDLVVGIRGGTEETTTGVVRLKTLEAERLLLYPIVAVNEAKSKSLFDNPIGTGQSAIDGILRATNMLLAGKKVVVCGFGRVGAGIAERARGLGAHVTVVEPDPIRALQAHMLGFRVSNLRSEAASGELFITATGNISVIRRGHMEKMRDGAIMANAGHMDVEICKPDLLAMASEVEEVRPCMHEYRLRDGRRLYLLADGRLVNLVCAEGHPSEVMDLSFSLQIQSILYLQRHGSTLANAVHDVPEEVDRRVAALKMKALGVELEQLTAEQEKYMRQWTYGT